MYRGGLCRKRFPHCEVVKTEHRNCINYACRKVGKLGKLVDFIEVEKICGRGGGYLEFNVQLS